MSTLVDGYSSGPYAAAVLRVEGVHVSTTQEAPIALDVDQPRRWMTVGRSEVTDSKQAGIDAARAATDGRIPKLLLVFVGITHDIAQVLVGINEVAGGVPLIGCSTHGEISVVGPRDGTVVVTAIGGEGFSIATTAIEGASGLQREAGAAVAETASLVDDLPYKVLIMLTDGFIRGQEDILRGAYGVLGARIPMFGGASADGWRFQRTYQLHGDQVLTDAVVGATIASDSPIAISVRHGWRKIGEPMIVTSCGEGRVHTLDDEPAMDVYLRRLRAPQETYRDAAAFSKFALSRPVGVDRRNGEEVRNFSTEVDMEGRSLGGGGDIPQGSLIWVMEGDEASILDAATDACSAALAGLGGLPSVGMLTLSCAALRAVLGDDGITREGARLSTAAGEVPFAGFYTYGEIARTKGIDGFHNQTIVVLAMS